MENSFIKSPLNYTGNKYRILEQITPFFPKRIKCTVDLFCGGATVGINSNAEKVIFVDSNPYVINLLIYLSSVNFESFIKDCEKLLKNMVFLTHINMDTRSTEISAKTSSTIMV